jgi:heat-inducible transcriptional repressor
MTRDINSDPELPERAQYLLKALVESYIQHGHPVGSRTLARTAGLDLSPATIRNVMADLEEFGLIRSPHTSSGRIPTARGYRLFVDNMLKVKPLRHTQVSELKERLDPDMAHQDLIESASSLLSGITHLAGIVTVPRREYAQLRQIEFLELSESRALAILVVNQKEVQNKIIHLNRRYSASELQEAANYINAHYAGKGLRLVRQAMLLELEAVRQDMNRAMASAIELGEKLFESEGEPGDDVMVVGQTHLMEYEELSSVETLRQLFDAFTRKQEMLHLLDKCILAHGVQIFIGQESGYEPLDECSVVSAPYSADGEVVGVLGVIGPTRMAYARVIPAVDITARLLGAALNPRD